MFSLCNEILIIECTYIYALPAADYLFNYNNNAARVMFTKTVNSSQTVQPLTSHCSFAFHSEYTQGAEIVASLSTTIDVTSVVN